MVNNTNAKKETRCFRMVASYVLLTFLISSTPIWHLGNFASREASIRPSECNLNLLEVMSFHLVPHLPRLIAMVAKFSV